MAQLHANALLNGRYRVEQLLAMGGMAEVWIARDLLLERPVAVKVLRAGTADELEASDRLRAEARTAAMLSSERVVRVHDVGQLVDDDGRSSPYLVMELVPGDTLRDHLHLPMDPEQVRRVITQVAEGLAEAHALGLVHRDIKPANILITPSGDAKVTDFGISCSADSAGLTATGLVMGTARYLSPEQVRGRRATSASDVYSLGVVAHEALRGEPMFAAGGDVETALAHVQQQPPVLPATVPADLAALVISMLAKEPGDRPTAAVLATGAVIPLPAVTPAPTRALPLVTQRTTERAEHRPRALVALGLAGVVLLGGAAAASWDSLDLTRNGSAVDGPLVTPTPTRAATPAPPVKAAVTTVASTASPRPAAPAPKPPSKHHKGKGKH